VSTNDEDDDMPNDEVQKNAIEMEIDQDPYIDLDEAGMQPLGIDDEEEETQINPQWVKDRELLSLTEDVPLTTMSQLLDPQLIRNLTNMKIEKLFPVQKEIIPYLLERKPLGGDVCISSPTGSGKTLTYTIPIVQVSLSIV
jgi:ATP-dependent RNA helicase DDX51/DBP6